MSNRLNLERIKKQIQKKVELYRKELIDLSRKIHASPEVGWHEHKASGWLTEYLEKNGFDVERGICNLPTAFNASYGEGRPVIAFMAEYDALPNIGHGCGHNIIATAAIGAGIAAKLAAEHMGGTILVLGTPAEELLGGKVIMVEKGAFDNIDVAIMVHPRAQNSPVGLRHLAAVSLEVEFWGKSAHAASAPWDGINALEAMIQSFVGINSVRQHLESRSRIHGIITDGGQAVNVIPEHSAGIFMVRAVDDISLDKLCGKVLSCLQAAALSTGTRLEYRWGLKCSAMRHNNALIQLWANNMKILGRKVDEIMDSPGSVDMGNVSKILPCIHPFIAISSEPIPPHSIDFAKAAVSDAGNQAIIDGAKALAMTAADVMIQSKILSRIKNEFKPIRGQP